VVEFGRRPLVQACIRCHLPNGGGHPESAGIAALPVNYIIRQMHDFKNGDRKSLGEGSASRAFNMINIVGDMTGEEIAEAAAYFANLPQPDWIEVIEAETVPATYLPPANTMRHVKPEGGTEPIGQRIVEIPEDRTGAEIRDSHASFIAYVPPGSIARGEQLAATGGGGKTIQCAICHGAGLKGLGDVPGIAGRSPVYMVRQIVDIQHGARKGASAALMQSVVANLTVDDMIALAAYVGSLDP